MKYFLASFPRQRSYLLIQRSLVDEKSLSFDSIRVLLCLFPFANFCSDLITLVLWCVWEECRGAAKALLFPGLFLFDCYQHSS